MTEKFYESAVVTVKQEQNITSCMREKDGSANDSFALDKDERKSKLLGFDDTGNVQYYEPTKDENPAKFDFNNPVVYLESCQNPTACLGAGEEGADYNLILFASGLSIQYWAPEIKGNSPRPIEMPAEIRTLLRGTTINSIIAVNSQADQVFYFITEHDAVSMSYLTKTWNYLHNFDGQNIASACYSQDNGAIYYASAGNLYRQNIDGGTPGDVVDVADIASTESNKVEKIRYFNNKIFVFLTSGFCEFDIDSGTMSAITEYKTDEDQTGATYADSRVIDGEIIYAVTYTKSEGGTVFVSCYHATQENQEFTRDFYLNTSATQLKTVLIITKGQQGKSIFYADADGKKYIYKENEFLQFKISEEIEFCAYFEGGFLTTRGSAVGFDIQKSLKNGDGIEFLDFGKLDYNYNNYIIDAFCGFGENTQTVHISFNGTYLNESDGFNHDLACVFTDNTIASRVDVMCKDHPDKVMAQGFKHVYAVTPDVDSDGAAFIVATVTDPATGGDLIGVYKMIPGESGKPVISPIFGKYLEWNDETSTLVAAGTGWGEDFSNTSGAFSIVSLESFPESACAVLRTSEGLGDRGDLFIFTNTTDPKRVEMTEDYQAENIVGITRSGGLGSIWAMFYIQETNSIKSVRIDESTGKLLTDETFSASDVWFMGSSFKAVTTSDGFYMFVGTFLKQGFFIKNTDLSQTIQVNFNNSEGEPPAVSSYKNQLLIKYGHCFDCIVSAETVSTIKIENGYFIGGELSSFGVCYTETESVNFSTVQNVIAASAAAISFPEDPLPINTFTPIKFLINNFAFKAFGRDFAFYGESLAINTSTVAGGSVAYGVENGINYLIGNVPEDLGGGLNPLVLYDDFKTLGYLNTDEGSRLVNKLHTFDQPVPLSNANGLPADVFYSCGKNPLDSYTGFIMATDQSNNFLIMLLPQGQELTAENFNIFAHNITIPNIAYETHAIKYLKNDFFAIAAKCDDEDNRGWFSVMLYIRNGLRFTRLKTIFQETNFTLINWTRKLIYNPTADALVSIGRPGEEISAMLFTDIFGDDSFYPMTYLGNKSFNVNDCTFSEASGSFIFAIGNRIYSVKTDPEISNGEMLHEYPHEVKSVNASADFIDVMLSSGDFYRVYSK